MDQVDGVHEELWWRCEVPGEALPAAEVWGWEDLSVCTLGVGLVWVIAWWVSAGREGSAGKAYVSRR